MRWRPQGLWQHPDFVKLWTGRTSSEVGSRITREGLPLTAALVLGAGPAQMALLAALGAAPVLVVGLLVGVWRGSFGKACGDAGYDGRADFSGDCLVDTTDFGLLRGNFGQAGPPTP